MQPLPPTERRRLGGAWILGALMACLVAWGAWGCDFDTTEPPDNEPGASVVNLPPLTPPILETFHATFFGWSFRGRVSCHTDARPIAIAIWEGITDPCTQTPNEENRVVFFEVSDILAGQYTIANACQAPPNQEATADRIARGFFGVVRGNRLVTQQAVEGVVTLQGVSLGDNVAGTFSVRFSGSSGFTSGTFRLRAACL
jgi:hypothetical protein